MSAVTSDWTYRRPSMDDVCRTRVCADEGGDGA